MEYFKVVDSISSPVVIDTDFVNYGLILKNQKRYESLLKFVEISSINLGLPLDMYFTLNNNLAMLGNEYLRNFPKSKNHIFEIYDFTHNENHKGHFILEKDLINVVENLNSIGISLFSEGFYLWEYILEYVRQWDEFEDIPSRRKSFFLFENYSDCKWYIDKHKVGGKICKVEIIETTSLFRADMNLIDSLQNHYNYREVTKIVFDYWSETISNKPIFEILFQGKCKLIPIE